jgi:uncharacterized protein (DUF302 family)
MTAATNRQTVRHNDTSHQPAPEEAVHATEKTMRDPHRRNLVLVAFTLSALFFGGNFYHDQAGLASQGANPMNVTRVTIDHVRVVAEKPFGEVTKAFEQQLGQFDPEVYKSLKEGEDPEKVRTRLEAMVGPSGFMLFRTSDHGALLRLAGQERKSLQYLVGNPLFAMRMTQHDIRASLYAPLRVLLYENERGKTCVEYDKPSSLFGQFGNAKVTEVATMLDRKLEQLVARATE